MQFLSQRKFFGIANLFLRVNLKKWISQKTQNMPHNVYFMFSLNFWVKICSAIFWIWMDLILSFRCSIEVNAFFVNAIIIVLGAQPGSRRLVSHLIDATKDLRNFA